MLGRLKYRKAETLVPKHSALEAGTKAGKLK
jgi:hypothetical protein